MSIDVLFHSVELSAMIGLAWKANRVLNRHLDILKDFPPHRHINGKIIYPRDFEPPQTEALNPADR